MRTTLDLDDSVLAAARAVARDQGISLGAAVSRLARRGLVGVGPIDTTGGFPTFTIDADAAPITLVQVNEFRD